MGYVYYCYHDNVGVTVHRLCAVPSNGCIAERPRKGEGCMNVWGQVISFETDGSIFVGEGSINELKDGYYAGNKGNPKKLISDVISQKILLQSSTSRAHICQPLSLHG